MSIEEIERELMFRVTDSHVEILDLEPDSKGKLKIIISAVRPAEPWQKKLWDFAVLHAQTK